MKQNLLKLTVLLLGLAAFLALSLNPSAAETTGSTLGEYSGAAAQPDGAALFGAKCATCHGKDGKGLSSMKSKGIPDFTDGQWHAAHSDAQIAETIKKGKGRLMPPFKAKLNDSEIAAVVARVRRFKR